MVLGREASPSDVKNTEQLLNWWAFGAGRQRWINSPHPWTTLRDLLLEHVSPHIADGLAANIFHRATGIWPGDRKGKDPVGPG